MLVLTLALATFRKLGIPHARTNQRICKFADGRFPALGTSCMNAFTRLVQVANFPAPVVCWLGCSRLSSGLAR